ncbi:DUF4411 family protein [Candidatus Sumerlaeota bacterium]|nr:DUF4411 family protein [Candidatus Sumerlaeota bacterium]
MAYLLDANVFISAKNLHYGFDFCPAFWEWLVERHRAGSVFSVEKVGYELRDVEDELSEWADVRGPSFFVPPDGTVAPSFRSVSEWTTGRHYEPAAIANFLQVADYYLAAQAHAGGHIVVTHEVPSSSIRKIKIPDVCIGLGITCVTPYEMLRRERARFVLGRAI